MKVLITGASGFVGRNVKEYFEQKKEYEICAPSSSELNCIDENRVKEHLQSNHYDVRRNKGIRIQLANIC